MGYLIYRIYSFECDVADCERTEDVGPGVTLRGARHELRRHGWTRSNDQDVCPHHSGHYLAQMRDAERSWRKASDDA